MSGTAGPARGLLAVSFGVGMAAALIAKSLAEMGASVLRVPPAGGDPSHAQYPAYGLWLRDTCVVAEDEAAARLAGADICIVGGEDFPGLRHWGDASALQHAHPRLIVVRVTGYPGEDCAALPAVDLLVQARTGVVYEQFSQRPIAAALPMPSYGAALQGLLGVWVALVERARSGLGQVVSVSLAAGAAMFWGPFWMKAERANAGFAGITPRDVRHLTLRCAEGEYIQMTMGVPGAVAKAYRALGIADVADPHDRGMPDHARGPAGFFGDVELLERYSRNIPREALMAALRDAGIPNEAVLAPGESWDDAQVAINGIVSTDGAGWSMIGNPLLLTTHSPFGTPLGPFASPARHDPAAPPLAGLRIIDCGIFVAGPYASKLLADYGAEVIRVEPPSGRSTLSGERTIIAANYGKRAICIDAKSTRGRELTAMLCARADVVMHNFRPGVSDRLGLDRVTLRRINPALIILETTAYGATGPKSGAPGFDMVIQAHCGLQQRAGGIGNKPLCSRSPLVDFASGAVGAVGLLAALYEHMNTGGVTTVETNLLNVGLHMMSELVRDPDGGFHGAAPVDATQTGAAPAESLYQTADGWIAIALRSPQMAAALANVLKLALPHVPAQWGETERMAIAGATAGWTTAGLLERLDAANVWAARCVRDAWEHVPPDGAIMRGMTDEVYGAVVHCIGPLIEFSRSRTIAPSRLSTPPGADTAEILAELGIGAAEAEALFEAGVVR